MSRKKPKLQLASVDDLTPGELSVIRLYMGGVTPQNIARQLRIDIKTVTAILDDPQVQSHVHATKLMALDTYAEVEDLMTDALTDSVKALHGIVKKGRDKDRIQAAKLLMTLHPSGRFAPRQKTDITTHGNSDAIVTQQSLALIEERLRELPVELYPVLQQLETKRIENEAAIEANVTISPDHANT